MGVEALLNIVYASDADDWNERNQAAFESLFGGPAGRYRDNAKKKVSLRAPQIADPGVRFSAFIHPENTGSGAYSGMSFVLFPGSGAPCLIGLVIGTQGLGQDETILGRPGHARKVSAICAWLNEKYGKGEQVAWAKQDPTRTDLAIPKHVVERWPAYQNVFARYGNLVYALYCPNQQKDATRDALLAFLDLYLEERDCFPMASSQSSVGTIRDGWFAHLMPTVEPQDVYDLLLQRRYVVLQGPPGTGKTRTALELLRENYQGRGQTIQFHPNTTYESFVGGLSPSVAAGDLGFRFSPTPGVLMRAAAQALENPSVNYLLHIDEINRADLGKILGEAIFLLEPTEAGKRTVQLLYDFGKPFASELFIPSNLHILGTMNSADRSIAILDVAVRRRFAFVSLWPRAKVVEEFGCTLMNDAFKMLNTIFIENAGGDAFSLVPGHSYFLETDEARARTSLRTNLSPLLEEYLSQGYVAGFAEPIRAYLQWVASQ